MDFSLNSYIKYCLGYLSLTRPSGSGFARGTPLDIVVPKKYFNLKNLLNGDTDGSLSETINLATYYETDPKDVSEDIADEYKKEKDLALQIHEIYNKAKNDTYTKETLLRFGRFDFEVIEEQIIDPDEAIDEGELVFTSKDTKEEKPKLVLKQFYLFSLPVRIEKEADALGIERYSLAPADFEVRLNLAPLYEIFRSYQKEELVYEFLNDYVKLEGEDKFSIPISNEEVFTSLWGTLKSKLKLTDAHFNDQSFDLHDLRLTLAPRSNFFLVEDLTKLSREKEELLEGTALSSWFSEDGLNVNTEVAEEKSLYFPFPYDKYQRATTSLLGNKASIIQGPPGTGKSETISNIISHLAVGGKKVLFVSQKAQALRVVKDKLKTLEVPLLFGYIPSVKFDKTSDEEADTISSQLASLDTYMNAGIGVKNKASLESFTETTETQLSKKDRIITLEREVYALEEEKKKLSFLDSLPKFDEEKVLSNLTDDLYSAYREANKKIRDNDSLIKDLENIARSFSLDGDLFADRICSSFIKAVLDDVSKTGFDRSFGLGRLVNNFSRKLRLKSSLNPLPKEVYGEIDKIWSKDISRHTQAKELEILMRYCTYWESIHENIKLKKQASEVESNLGISPQDFEVLNNFLKEHSLTVSRLIGMITDRLNIENKKKDLITKIKELKQEVTNSNAPTRKEVIAQYLSAIVEGNIRSNVLKISVHRKLMELQKAFKKGKKAFKTFDRLKSDATNFQTILDIVPVWVMDLDDASRLIPLVPNLFDYVLFDEASQCNIAYTIPAMYRAKKAVFVGDPEQMRDSTVMFKTNQAFDQLAHRYKVPESLQIKPTGTAVQSVLDIARTRFGVPRILQYHYRSPMELIGFSNHYFYEPKGKRLIALNNKYLTYGDTNRIMLIHQVKYDGGTGDKTNRAEALKALDLYREMIEDPRYKNKSFAILAFFNDQAELIRSVFEENKFKESDKLKIAIIEGIQGDEKDIAIYSFVIRDPAQKRQYIALTGETGDIRSDINAGRVNVAFSRARLQVHCLISMPIEQVPSGIWIKRFLEYVRDNGEVSSSDLTLKPFDSFFEKEFYHLLKKKLGRKYTIQNQVESCGFKIDFVATNTDTGKQLAIECDGPTHFKDSVDESYGIYVESDIQRQKVLESAGWTFYRVGYSEWIENDQNKDELIKNVKAYI